LFGIDDAFAEVVTSSTQPALGAIRLAWWREALERLDHNAPPPEPRLQDAAAELLPRGISGAALAELEAGWAALLDETIDPDRSLERGERLFSLASELLGADDPKLPAAGRLFASEQVARKGLPGSLQMQADLDELRGHRFARALRPLTALARLAARDARQAPEIEPEATPGRAVALLSHRLFGTVT